MVEMAQVVCRVSTTCAICNDDDAFAEPGLLIFRDGSARPDLACRRCWLVISICSVAWILHLNAEGEDAPKWIQDALERRRGSEDGQSPQAVPSERNETV